MTISTALAQPARVRRSEQEWAGVFTRFEQSGQTIEQFCAQQGLALSTFNRWRHRLRTQCHKAIQGSPEAVFVELTTGDAPPTVVPPAWDVELGKDIFLRRTQIKVLAFEDGGYCLWRKRLEQGQFATLGVPGERKRVLSCTALLALIEGVDMVVKRQRKRYKIAA